MLSRSFPWFSQNRRALSLNEADISELSRNIFCMLLHCSEKSVISMATSLECLNGHISGAPNDVCRIEKTLAEASEWYVKPLIGCDDNCPLENKRRCEKRIDPHQDSIALAGKRLEPNMPREMDIRYFCLSADELARATQAHRSLATRGSRASRTRALRVARGKRPCRCAPHVGLQRGRCSFPNIRRRDCA